MFVGVVSGHALRLEQKGNRLLYCSAPRNFPLRKLRRYLGLDGPYAAAIGSFPKDALLDQTVERFRGMRLLQQDPWETLISFIISANNNITRIRNCIESLCRTFGRDISPGSDFYSFPSPEALAGASMKALRDKCNVGYRDAYLRESAKRLSRNPKLLSEIARLSYPQAKKAIMDLPGVGPKVADCVLLYSMGKFDAFPVDTWIRKTIRDNYFSGEHLPPSKIRVFAREHFGPFAGYAQLYLFHYAQTTGA